jgi:AraC-like DNA-binding protein
MNFHTFSVDLYMLSKPSLENINAKLGDYSFVAYRFSIPRFKFNWHFHPEYELTYIIRGSGMRLIGDSYEAFTVNDLVLIGPNLPHSWASEGEVKGQSCVVIQFSESFIGDFLKYEEFTNIKKLLNAARQSLHFPKAPGVYTDILALPNKNGFERIIGLLTILNKLAQTKSHVLASEFFKPIPKNTNQDRITTIFNYLHSHSSEPISISQMALMINLSESAFCKFFKRASNRTFSDYLNDLRVGHACKLLSETEYSISEVAYAVGFESLTYFNRVFFKKKGKSPTSFRRLLYI